MPDADREVHAHLDVSRDAFDDADDLGISGLHRHAVEDPNRAGRDREADAELRRFHSTYPGYSTGDLALRPGGRP